MFSKDLYCRQGLLGKGLIKAANGNLHDDAIKFSVEKLLSKIKKISNYYTPRSKWRGLYWNDHGCPSVCQAVCLSVCPSVYPWAQFCLELFSYNFAHTALKFIHNVCVHMKLRMCNFHDDTIIGCGIIFP